MNDSDETPRGHRRADERAATDRVTPPKPRKKSLWARIVQWWRERKHLRQRKKAMALPCPIPTRPSCCPKCSARVVPFRHRDEVAALSEVGPKCWRVTLTIPDEMPAEVLFWDTLVADVTIHARDAAEKYIANHTAIDQDEPWWRCAGLRNRAEVEMYLKDVFPEGVPKQMVMRDPCKWRGRDADYGTRWA